MNGWVAIAFVIENIQIAAGHIANVLYDLVNGSHRIKNVAAAIAFVIENIQIASRHIKNVAAASLIALAAVAFVPAF